MNTDRLILELFDRVKALEEKVSALENNKSILKEDTDFKGGASLVDRARALIQSAKDEAFESGNESIILICGEIQKALGVSNRVPSICQAMRDCMGPDDTVLEEPPSGMSTRLTIEYRLSKGEERMENTQSDKVITLRQLRTGFERYFKKNKPDYKYPGPLFGMAFYITKHFIGVSLEDLFSKKVSLNEYSDILYDHFYKLNPDSAYVRTSAYKDAMKNLLEYADYMNYGNVKIELE